MPQPQFNPLAVVIAGSVWSAAFIVAFASHRPTAALALLAVHGLALLVAEARQGR